MKLLAFGDLHLGAGGSLGRGPGDRLLDQERVLEQILALGAIHGVDAFLMAGDLFEGPTITPAILEAFIRPFEKLNGEIPLIAINGNGGHDLARQPVDALQPLRHVPGVHVYSRPAVHALESGVIACLPWVSPDRLIAAHGGDGRDNLLETAQRLLVTVAEGLNEACAGCDSVLMLHGSLSGASIPTGLSTDQLGPVIDTDALADLDFHALVASHIHQVQVYCAGTGEWTRDVEPGTTQPPWFYTGSPLPLNFGETDGLHGCWLLEVNPIETRAEFVPIPSRPLRQSHLDLADLEVPGVDPVVDFDGILDPGAWPDVDDAIVKVILHATRAQQRRLELARLRDALLAAGAHTVKIEVDTVREERSRVDGVTEDLEPLAAFDAWVASAGVHPDLAARVREQMQRDLEAVA